MRARLHQALRQARQERRGRRGGDLRGDVAARDAFRAGQERRSAGRVDVAQDPGSAGQAANDERQRVARPSSRVRPHRGQGHSSASRSWSPWRWPTRVFPKKPSKRWRCWPGRTSNSTCRSTALEKAIAKASAKSPDEPLAAGDSRHRPAHRLGDGGELPDPGVFKSGRDFAASLGLTPSQHSSGGKEKLGAITKKGNRYLRKMLVVGCTSVLRVAHKHKGALAEWIVAMRGQKARAGRRGGPGQQTGPHMLGGPVDRRGLPRRALRQSLKPATNRNKARQDEVQRFAVWQAQRRDDPTVATESRGHPASRHEPSSSPR